jgi:ribose 5-phosphate isomerase B
MKVYFASDHAGFELKQVLLPYVRDLGYEVEDCGEEIYQEDDDYPDVVKLAAKKVSDDPDNTKAIILGGSGQGEAMVANRFKRVRASVYYGGTGIQTDQKGKTFDIIESVRGHNDANVLSLGARFLNEEEAKQAVTLWLNTPFSGDERHRRRIEKIEKYPHG